MADGKVLGVHNGMVLEYDPSTLAPLGLVVGKDELKGNILVYILALIITISINPLITDYTEPQESSNIWDPMRLSYPQLADL